MKKTRIICLNEFNIIKFIRSNKKGCCMSNSLQSVEKVTLRGGFFALDMV